VISRVPNFLAIDDVGLADQCVERRTSLNARGELHVHRLRPFKLRSPTKTSWFLK